jgi:single-strand DNA-binding protein
VNKAIIIGHLGRDPETRPVGETQVCNFTVATTERFKDRNGDKQKRTEWHRVVAWGKLAEICDLYLKKGKQVSIEGRLQTREWEKDGVKRYTTEIVANDMEMLGKAGEVQDDYDTPDKAEPDDTTDDTDDSDDLPF